MDQQPENGRASTGISTPVLVALIGAAATVLTALVTGFFGLAGRGNDPGPAPTVPATTVDGTQPAVRIVGPPVVALGASTEFDIISENATRAIWSIGGFNNNETQEVEPLGPSHRIFVAPEDPASVGNTYTIAVTVYAADGRTASATHEFLIANGAAP